MTIDPYTFLWVFAAGVLAQALLIVRQPRRMGAVAGLAIFALAVAWFFIDYEDDIAFQVTVFSTLLFILLFAVVFRDLAMPRVSRRALLHYSLVWYYGVWLTLRAAPVHMDTWVYVTAAVPPLLTLVVGLWPRQPWRWVRVLMYLWFLLVMMSLLGMQLRPGRLQEVYEASGFSFELLAYGFVSGAVFLLFGVYFIYATMLLVARDRRLGVWARLSGATEYSVAAEQADEMARRVADAGPSVRTGLLLGAHALLLYLNGVYSWVAPGLVINASIVGIAWVGLPQYQSSPPSTRSSS